MNLLLFQFLPFSHERGKRWHRFSAYPTISISSKYGRIKLNWNCWIYMIQREKLILMSGCSGVTGIFFTGGKATFPDFSRHEICFFLVEISHFGTPQTNFSGFKKVKSTQKKKKKHQTNKQKKKHKFPSEKCQGAPPPCYATFWM